VNVDDWVVESVMLAGSFPNLDVLRPAVVPDERPLSATKQAPVAADVPETWSDETAIGADRLTIDPATIRAG